ncbi:hypothetical protein Tco_1113168 [Tanacetum coccineum]|uniref:Tf2-1-like SH3-like domain-containing protein n=1 Tax=Tanacetum coccineum TaxID=301880 RepID=A0ABQ5ISX7_9ASTR
MIQPNRNQPERPETEDDLTGDNLKQYEVDIEVMNLILISIPNDIYNSMDSCQTAKFDQFTTEPGESLLSVNNHFSQLMNDLKRNKVELPNVTVNTIYPEFALNLNGSIQIRQRLQAARDRERSYANVRRKPLEFQVGDHVMLKVSPVAYKLELPEELSNVRITFHVSNLKKCLSDESLVIPMKEL